MKHVINILFVCALIQAGCVTVASELSSAAKDTENSNSTYTFPTVIVGDDDALKRAYTHMKTHVESLSKEQLNQTFIHKYQSKHIGGSTLNPALLAIKHQDVFFLNILLEKKANVNYEDELGSTLLHTAVLYDNKILSLAWVLVQHGAISKRDKNGNIPFARARKMLPPIPRGLSKEERTKFSQLQDQPITDLELLAERNTNIAEAGDEKKNEPATETNLQQPITNSSQQPQNSWWLPQSCVIL